MVEACAQDFPDHSWYHSHIVVGPEPLQIGEVEVETRKMVASFPV